MSYGYGNGSYGGGGRDGYVLCLSLSTSLPSTHRSPLLTTDTFAFCSTGEHTLVADHTAATAVVVATVLGVATVVPVATVVLAATALVATVQALAAIE